MDNDQRYEELYDVASEIILLGHVMNRIGMITEYGDKLGENDFYDRAVKEIWHFLNEYYKEYSGEELDPMKVNMLYSKLKMDKVLKFSDAKHDKKPYKAIFGFESIWRLCTC